VYLYTTMRYINRRFTYLLTYDDSTYRASIASRGNNTNKLWPTSSN